MTSLPDNARAQCLHRLQGGLRSRESRDHADMLPVLEPLRGLIEAVFNNDDPEIIEASEALVDAIRQCVALEVEEMWAAVHEDTYSDWLRERPREAVA